MSLLCPFPPKSLFFHQQLGNSNLSKDESLILQVGTCTYPIFSPLPCSSTNFSVSKFLKQQICYHSFWEVSVQPIAKRNQVFPACIWKRRNMEKPSESILLNFLLPLRACLLCMVSTTKHRAASNSVYSNNIAGACKQNLTKSWHDLRLLLWALGINVNKEPHLLDVLHTKKL